LFVVATRVGVGVEVVLVLFVAPRVFGRVPAQHVPQHAQDCKRVRDVCSEGRGEGDDARRQRESERARPRGRGEHVIKSVVVREGEGQNRGEEARSVKESK
jgi:hypothetical protein